MPSRILTSFSDDKSTNDITFICQAGMKHVLVTIKLSISDSRVLTLCNICLGHVPVDIVTDMKIMCVEHRRSC